MTKLTLSAESNSHPHPFYNPDSLGSICRGIWSQRKVLGKCSGSTGSLWAVVSSLGGEGEALCFWREQGAWPGAPRHHPAPPAPGTAFWHTLRGRASRFPEFTRRCTLSCPCSVSSHRKDAQRGGGWGMWKTAAHQAGGSQWGQATDPGTKPIKPCVELWTEEKSHHCAGENKGFSDGFKIWSDFYLEPSSWLVAGEDGCWTGQGMILSACHPITRTNSLWTGRS